MPRKRRIRAFAADDAAVGRNDDRRDDSARFEKAEIEVGGRPLRHPSDSLAAASTCFR